MKLMKFLVKLRNNPFENYVLLISSYPFNILLISPNHFLSLLKMRYIKTVRSH